MPPETARACVIGAGSWGTALATVLCRRFDEVFLCGRDPLKLKQIAADARNQHYLPEIALPQNLRADLSVEAVAESVTNFIIAAPSRAFRETLEQLHQCMRAPDAAVIIWGSKGLEPQSGKLLSEVAAEIFPPGACLGVISGPSFALETAAALPTALTLACNQPARAETFAAWFRAPTLRVYVSDDLTGVQLGGAIKNVIAIAAGISDGLGYGANARAALITRGLAELTRLGVALGGRAETFAGLAGVGDLILTCTDDQSRNRRFGLALAEGRKAAEICADIGQEIEGMHTVKQLLQKSRAARVDLPIVEQVYLILHEQKPPADAVQSLLARDAARE